MRSGTVARHHPNRKALWQGKETRPRAVGRILMFPQRLRKQQVRLCGRYSRLRDARRIRLSLRQSLNASGFKALFYGTSLGRRVLIQSANLH